VLVLVLVLVLVVQALRWAVGCRACYLRRTLAARWGLWSRRWCHGTGVSVWHEHPSSY
jgi:hypothetical protein